MNGFIHKEDHKGRYGFAVHCITDDEPNLELKGVWLLRGTKMPKFMKEDPSLEYYKKRQLDCKHEDRKLIENIGVV